jgi:predicted PurR-regulated permease PerM
MNQSNSFDNSKFNNLVDTIIRLSFLFLIIAWCLNILSPFSGVIIWGVILALALYPWHQKLSTKLKNRKKLASVILVITGLLCIFIPTWLFVGQVVTSFSELNNDFNTGNLELPPVNPKIAEWPLIGEDLFNLWEEASQSLESFFSKYKEQFLSMGETLFEGVKSISESLITIILSIVIAGALLAGDKAQNLGRIFFFRLAGEKGDQLVDIISKTVENVVKGVIGVALIQAFLIGLGMLGAGVPYAGVWALLVLIMAILQLPVIPIIIILIIWLFNDMGTLGAVLWSIYFVAAGLSDTPLKAMLFGKGASVPMLVIFLGVIGGFMNSGFIGLFTGAIIISIGYSLLMTWLNENKPSDFKGG